MRRVTIVADRPNETYAYAAIDQQTSEIPLRLADRGDLVALCCRLGWTVRDDANLVGETSAVAVPRRSHNRKVGGATKYVTARRRRIARSASLTAFNKRALG